MWTKSKLTLDIRKGVFILLKFLKRNKFTNYNKYKIPSVFGKIF